MSEATLLRASLYMAYAGVVVLSVVTVYFCGFIAYVGFTVGLPWLAMEDVPLAVVFGLAQLSALSLRRTLRHRLEAASQPH